MQRLEYWMMILRMGIDAEAAGRIGRAGGGMRIQLGSM